MLSLLIGIHLIYHLCGHGTFLCMCIICCTCQCEYDAHSQVFYNPSILLIKWLTLEAILSTSTDTPHSPVETLSLRSVHQVHFINYITQCTVVFHSLSSIILIHVWCIIVPSTSIKCDFFADVWDATCLILKRNVYHGCSGHYRLQGQQHWSGFHWNLHGELYDLYILYYSILHTVKYSILWVV